MLKIRAGWGAVISAGLCLLLTTSLFAADEYLVIERNQEAEINRSFNRVNGVANANSTAGNLNNQTAITTISSSASGFAADNYRIRQGYSGFFIVGNTIYGQGVLSQDINVENNRVVVRQRTLGFLVDARNTLGLATISHSFRDYTGLAIINQAVGNLNNQVTMAGVNFGPSQSLSSVHAGSPLRVYSNISYNTLLDSGSSYKAVIDGGSFRNYSGMLAVSQTVGNLNNTVNSVGLLMNAAPEIGQALSNNHLGNVTALNKKNDNVIVGKGECPEVNIENGAFKNFTGVASITQVAGNVNQVVTQVGVSVR